MTDPSSPEASLLAPDEPPAFEFIAGRHSSPFLITCDHAGRRLPRALADLGVSASELERHIAWDIGAAGVTRQLAALLDASAVLQTYSRLAIDCNRPPSVPSSIVEQSEATLIPGNHALSAAARAARVAAIFQPYHDRILAELNERAARAQPTVLIAMHSFTPEFHGVPRPWHAGVLYNRDTRLAHAVLELLRADSELVVGDNEPYAVSDASDYGVVVYGEQRGNLHVELEVRQDLITTEAEQAAWAARLAPLFRRAASRFLG